MYSVFGNRKFKKNRKSQVSEVLDSKILDFDEACRRCHPYSACLLSAYQYYEG